MATRLCVIALVWVACVSAEAAAALPPGAPKLRVARATDTTSQPRAYQEWWDVRLRDPRSDATVLISFRRTPDGSGFSVRGLGRDHVTLTEASGGGAVSATPGGLSAGSSRVTFTRRTAGISLQAEHLSGQLTVKRLRRGPAALGFDLGQGRFNPQVVPEVTLNWSMPIGYGVAHGAIDLWDKHIDVGGWLVSYTHTWGDLLEDDTAWTHWDQWLVQRGAATWIAFGVNRRDTITGPGAREAMWLGLLARVGGRGSTVCRPRVERRHWTPSIDPGGSIPGWFRARCRGLGVTFTDVQTLRSAIDAPNFTGLVAPALEAGRGSGWVVHRTTTS